MGGQWEAAGGQAPQEPLYSPAWELSELQREQRGRGARGRGLLSELH